MVAVEAEWVARISRCLQEFSNGPDMKRDKSVKHNLSGWDKAIAGAKKGIARLKAALEHAVAMKEAGEPWPGEKKGAT